LHNDINIPDIQCYLNSLPVGKGRLKERCGLEELTSFFSFKKVAKTRCGLDSRTYGILYIYPIKTQFAFDESIRDCAHVTTVVFPHDAI
jgi:hypothetical protein